MFWVCHIMYLFSYLYCIIDFFIYCLFSLLFSLKFVDTHCSFYLNIFATKYRNDVSWELEQFIVFAMLSDKCQHRFKFLCFIAVKLDFLYWNCSFSPAWYVTDNSFSVGLNYLVFRFFVSLFRGSFSSDLSFFLSWPFWNENDIKPILMAQCKTAVTPLLMHWSYCSLALSHQSDLFKDENLRIMNHMELHFIFSLSELCWLLGAKTSLSHSDGLMQERRSSSALTMELLLSCTNPSIYPWPLRTKIIVMVTFVCLFIHLSVSAFVCLKIFHVSNWYFARN